MAEAIPKAFKDGSSRVAFAQLATLMSDGNPQATPVWCDFDGIHVRVNATKGWVKDKNMRRDKRVTLSVQDPDNPFRCQALQGEIAGITEDGTDAHIDQLAKKYLGKDKYPFRAPGELRVVFKIRQLKIHTMG